MHHGARRVEISGEEVNALFSITIYDCFHTTKTNRVEYTFIHISNGEWRLHNLWISINQHPSQYLVCTNCQAEHCFI